MVDFLERLQLRLAGFNAHPLLAVLGLTSGLISGGIIILFRKTVETTQSGLLPDGGIGDFETLTTLERFFFPATGGLILAIILHFFSKPGYRFGVVHILERLAYFEGNMPIRNMILQFVGVVVALVSGQSVGREGPSAHLGAASSSLMGNYLLLPNNSIRTLVACGTAAAIAASFNTPLAGVIFAMEVVMMEYTIAGFTPVILAAFSATVLTQWVYGSDPAFSVPPFEMYSFHEIPIVLFMGIILGALAAGFISSLSWVTENNRERPVFFKMILAGFGVGLCAIVVPEIMGIGYDTVDLALHGTAALSGLVIIVLFKVIATSLSIGLGVPGGLIGPTIFMGATAGGALGLLVGYLPMEGGSHPGFYAMLGMAAMMSACLQAPLAALVTLLELTANPNIILPGMLVIISANLTAKELFSKESIFMSQMRASGLYYKNDPITQSLRRLSVASVMDHDFVSTDQIIDRKKAEELLVKSPRWLIIERVENKLLMPAADLSRFLEEVRKQELEPLPPEDQVKNKSEKIDLMEIPSHRQQLTSVHRRATLQEAREIMEASEVEALFVIRISALLNDQDTDLIQGIIDREAIEKSYRS
ncbi:MAG: chloride channel protein [Gammaproteobacteria bacterium]